MNNLDEIKQYFDADWYLMRYPDVAEADIDAWTHYVGWGFAEGRDANATFDAAWYAEQYLSGSEAISHPLLGQPLFHYARVGRKEGSLPNALIDLDFVRAEYGLSEHEDVLTFFVSRGGTINKINGWFSRTDYLTNNPDVASDPFSPEIHFWRHGILERRIIGNGVLLKPDDGGCKLEPFEHVVSEVQVGDRTFDVVFQLVPDTIIRQIKAQAKLEPDIVAAGVPCLPHLKKFDATDLKVRDHIDYRKILDQVPFTQDAIIIMPRIQLGGAEKYAAQLAWGLSQIGLRSVLIITTDSSPTDDSAALEHEALAVLQGFRIISLHEAIRGTWKQDLVLALLVLLAQPKYLFVVNSDLGLRTVKNYGRPLSANMKIFCAFFSESPNAIGSPYSARYLRAVLPYASVLSDNTPALTKWSVRLGGYGPEKFRLLSPLVRGIGPMGPVSANVAHNSRCVRNKRRALWISRWEPFKAIDVLKEIALRQPDCEIDAFGPVQSSDLVEDLPRNIKMNGVARHPSRLPIDKYDALLFTSYFEGMPNIVLEMAMLGIPIVASDVGGLSDTFPEGTIKLVSMEGSRGQVAGRFLSAFDELCAEHRDERAERITRSRQAVVTNHGREKFLRSIADMLGEEIA